MNATNISLNYHRLLLASSLVLNVALTGVLALRFYSYASGPVAAESERIDGRVEATSARPAPRPALAAAMPVNWTALWSGGYKRAADELRKSGFPESVVEDIVAGSINRRYGSEILALRREAWEFWRPEQRRARPDAELARARETQAAAIEAERSRALEEALGLPWKTLEQTFAGRPGPVDKYVQGVPVQHQAHASRVLEKYDSLERTVIHGANGTIGIPERAELNALYQQKLRELASFLSPSELEEYELRAGPIAARMRQLDLIGFDPSEDEFRAIYRIRKSFEQTQAEADLGAAGGRARAWQAQSAMELQLEEALGTERYQDYRRSMDYTYRGLVELTAEFDVPPEAAARVHRLRESALQSMHMTRGNSALGEEERIAALERIRSEAEKAVRELLGQAAYQRYVQMQISGWLENNEAP